MIPNVANAPRVVDHIFLYGTYRIKHFTKKKISAIRCRPILVLLPTGKVTYCACPNDMTRFVHRECADQSPSPVVRRLLAGSTRIRTLSRRVALPDARSKSWRPSPCQSWKNIPSEWALSCGTRGCEQTLCEKMYSFFPFLPSLLRMRMQNGKKKTIFRKRK